MAWQNIEDEMKGFFKQVAKGVRDDMDSGLTHIIDYNYTVMATGFAKAAEDLSGQKDSSYKREFKEAIAIIMDQWQLGADTNLTPGDVFRRVKTTGASGGKGFNDVPIPNAKVISNESKTGTNCVICIRPSGSGGSGSYNPSTFNKWIRKKVWNEFNKGRKSLGGTKKPITYNAGVVGKATPFAHDQQSTVGLMQMGALDDQLQHDQSAENPFVKADAFIGNLGRRKSISMSSWVADQLLGVGASATFNEELVTNSQGNLEVERVVRGTFAGRNAPGSELTDKRHFNKYIKEYYEKNFLQYFDARTKEGKKTMKAMGFKTAADFRGSKSFRDVKKEEVLNKVGTKLAKSVNVTAKVPKKPKPSKRKKTYKPKNVKKPKYSSEKAIAVSKKGKKAKRKTAAARIAKDSHSPIALQQLLNKALAKELQKNMTGVYPRSLEYRTGRFAQSAEVTSIVPFPKMTQIQYTYQKDPYQVFEPEGGNPLASRGRDPKNIIGGTIRELAQSIMGSRFGLVRTKRV